MPASAVSSRVRPVSRRCRRPQLETATPLAALAVARQVVEEASLWLGVPLPGRYAAGLAHRARRVYAHSAPFRRRMSGRQDGGRERLYMFMRHWLAARLRLERSDLFQKLPASYRTGSALPASQPALSNEARLLFGLA